MKLTEMTVSQFLTELGSDSPAPGGGSTAALEGAMGAALSAMVHTLTTGKAAYADYETQIADGLAQTKDLSNRLLAAVDSDTAAFLTVSEAFSMPKGTDAEKQARSAAIQKGLALCTESPFQMMVLSVETLAGIQRQLGYFNQSAASDLGVAALSLGAAVRGAWLNVLINLQSLKDKELAQTYQSKGQALLERADALSSQIYDQILALLQA